MLITVALLEHSNSYIMHKLTDLFCLTILFAKFIISASFILHFLANIEGYIPTKFSNRARAVSCPIKYEGKLFMADGEQIVLGKFIGGLLYMEG